ncbi:phosphoglycerate dehydrogenase [Glycomyces tenuis]|uniref:phosphoglycerate dehydrogenase n=1 Tax=Glycomyces tenuis TaxID=58116 RepID=UPI0003F89DC5|nr:phosphoglycerate dehydrogenase [Glycomyces tenuis]
MTRGRVLVTTAWLRPDDEVHRYLRDSDLEVAHSSFKDRARTGERLIDLVGPFDAVIAGTDPFTAEVLDAAPKLRVIGRTGVGYDNIDVEAATARGIAVCPTPGVNRQSVAEHTIGLLLAAARMIPQNVASVRGGGWDQVSGRELGGAVLGVVGLGAIGKLVATMAQGLGMTVIAHDPFPDHEFAREHGIREAGLDELLGEADFVSLHLFLSPETRHLIDAAAIAKMKDGAFLVNAARGGVVHEDALADALASGKLAGAALDTVEVEPLPADSRLRGLDNLVVTAHIGAATVESRARSGMTAARSVVDGLEGRIPPQTVNPQCVRARAAS